VRPVPEVFGQVKVRTIPTGLHAEHVLEVEAPRPRELHCPACGKAHVDRGVWATRPHRTHLCEHCGETWRPFEYATVGIEPLEGIT
jgi:hypothetical protein